MVETPPICVREELILSFASNSVKCCLRFQVSFENILLVAELYGLFTKLPDTEFRKGHEMFFHSKSLLCMAF